MKNIRKFFINISVKTRFMLTVLSIVFGFLGILGLLFSIQGNRVEEDIVIFSDLTDVSARLVRMWSYSDRRKFNEGVFPRDMLDSLEVDYNNYADWIESHKNYLDSRMAVKDSVDMSRIGKPVLLSSLSGSLQEICDRYLQEIELYNIRANKLRERQDKAVTLKNMNNTAEVLSAVFIMLSFLLQLFLAFCNYYIEKESLL